MYQHRIIPQCGMKKYKFWKTYIVSSEQNMHWLWTHSYGEKIPSHTWNNTQQFQESYGGGKREWSDVLSLSIKKGEESK